MAIGYSLRMCARDVDSANPGRSNLVFSGSRDVESAYYDDTKYLKLFIRFSNFFGPSNQTSKISVRNKIFSLYKKYFEADALSNIIQLKKSKTTNDGFWVPVS